MISNIGVVISRYNEDVDWARNIIHKVYLYNKGNRNILLDHVCLENVGREAHTYLHHIVSNYDGLDEYTVFLQGNPIDHGFFDQFSTIESFNNTIITKDFYPFLRKSENFNYLTCDKNGGPHINVDLIKFAENHGFVLDSNLNYFEFVQGAQFAVKKELITANPKSMYEKLLITLQRDGANSIHAHAMERLWKYIFVK